MVSLLVSRGFPGTSRDDLWGASMGLWYHCQGWTSNSWLLEYHGISLSIGCTSTISWLLEYPYQHLSNYWNPMDIHPIFISGIRILTLQILPRNGHFSRSEYFVNDIPRLWLVKPGSILIKEGEACILLVPFPSLVLVTGFLPPNFFIFVDKTALASGYNQYYCCLEKPFFLAVEIPAFTLKLDILQLISTSIHQSWTSFGPLKSLKWHNFTKEFHLSPVKVHIKAT